MYRKFQYTLITLIAIQTGMTAQSENPTRLNYNIKPVIDKIVLDGVPDDKEWNRHEVITNFYNHFPTDIGNAENQTEVRITYDNEFIYFLAKMHDNGNRVIQTLERDDDFALFFSDAFNIVIDPTNQQQNGFMFGVNSGGAEIEATLELFGSQTIYAPNWDQRWFSTTQQYEDYWIAEMAIPFRSLKYDKENLSWGINFVRIDREKFINSTWTLFPVNFNSIDMNYMGTLTWDKPIEGKSSLFTLNPYVTFSNTKDFQNGSDPKSSQDFNIGGDVKINLNSNLNLDLTVLPDFSNADVDQEVTNITRFNIFLPEQRNFFLDNADIFTSFGNGTIRPFFSRRIGLSNGSPIPIDFGARLTGNITPGLRLGLMNVQTDGFNNLPAENFAVGAFQQRLFKRSTIKGIFINRQATGKESTSEYSRNAGVEFDYINPSGRFNNSLLFHASFTSEKLSKNYYYGFNGGFTNKNIRANWLFESVGENFITDVGINPRLENFNSATEASIRVGFKKIDTSFEYIFVNDNQAKKIANHGPKTAHLIFLNPDGSLNESNNSLEYSFNFRNTAIFELNNEFNRINLLFPTSLIGDEFEPLPVDDYSFLRSGVRYRTDRRKLFIFEGAANYGGFYNGNLLNINVETSYRIQPWANFGLVYDYNNIQLGEGFGDKELHLLRFTGNFTFTKNLLFNNVLQYNTQGENFSIFSRFQWRFAPMSDLFVIFNQNQNTNGLGIQNRGFIVKLTYWL